MDFKSLLSKIDDLHEDRKTHGSFEKLERSVADRAAADAAANQKKPKSKAKEKDPAFDTSALASTLGGKLPKKPVGTVSKIHKTPDFDLDDEDDGSEIVREQGVAEGSENQYSVKHDHPTNKNKYAFSTISAPDIKTAKKLANEKFDGVVSVQRLIKQQFAMEGVTEGTQQPRNLKEWMNRVEGINETQVKAPISVIQGGKPVQATITSTSTNPTDTNVLQAAAEILKKGQGQIQMSPTQSAGTSTATTPSTQTTQQSAKPSTIQPVQPVKEEELDEVAAPGQEDWIKANKQRFIDQYGKKKGLSVLYATAWKRSKGKSESMNESKSPVMEGYTLEDILQRYPHEHKMCQEGWGLDESLYEALADHYHKEGRIPYKVWHGPLEELRDHVTKCYAEDTGMLMDESIETASPGDAQLGPISGVDEGMGGAAAGAALGRVAGTALGGPVGGMIGGAVGSKLGSEAQDMLSDDIDELDDLENLDSDEEFPFPDDMEGEDSMSVDQMNDMEQDDLLDEEDYMMEAKKHNKKLSEETKETKTGRVHKAEPGGYGRKDDENNDGKKVKKDAPKRGRGRPKKDADGETGEVKKWDTETLARWIVGSKPKTLPGKASVKHKIKDESAKKDPQMESWDRELKALLNEGMTITTSTGQPGGMDSVSVSATDSDAQTLLRLLQDAGIGLGGKSGGADHGEGQSISVEPVAHDEVMSQLQPEEDGGDDALGFIKRMLGARGGDTAAVDVDYEQEGDHDHMGHDEESCEECGHSPCDCDAEKVDEAEVEEGNAFTGALAKARADGVQAGEKMNVDGKEYPVKHGKKMDEENEHDSDDHDSEEDDEEDEEEDKDKVDEGQQTCNECGGAMYEGHQCGSEELTEWANSPMGKSADEDFKTEIEYMTKLISGGLNGQKRDQTTLPHTKVKTEIVKEDISATMKKLAGIK